MSAIDGSGASSGAGSVHNTPPPTAGLEGSSGSSFQGHSLGDLKAALIAKLGPEEGEKNFKKFTSMMFNMMFKEMQKSADHALAEQKKQRHEMGG